MSKLPTKADFTRSVEVLTCPICQEDFDKQHQPVKLGCGHIFGSVCLETWLESNQRMSNTCPHCRKVLFKKSNRPKHPTFVTGTGPREGQRCGDLWLENLKSQEQADSFMKYLWKQLFDIIIFRKTPIYDTDLDERLLQAADYSAKNQKAWYKFVQSDHLPAVREVMKKMINEMFGALERKEITVTKLDRFDFSTLKDSWATKEMGKALQWKFEEEYSLDSSWLDAAYEDPWEIENWLADSDFDDDDAEGEAADDATSTAP